MPQAARVKRGLARTFQITALFRRLSVLENVTLAVREREGVAGDLLRPAGRHRAVIEEAFALLERLGLADARCGRSTTLAYGRQRLVEIAVALGLAPKVLLLDEPAAGVPSGETGRIIAVDRAPAGRHRRADHRPRHGSGVPPGADGSPCWCRGASWSRGRREAIAPTRGCARSISASAVRR